jgi:hypothetical protein
MFYSPIAKISLYRLCTRSGATLFPNPRNGVAAPLANDVFKDRRGLLWVTDKERGLDVIEYKN